MAENKRFFWLKLKEDFFEDETIEWLEEQPNGKEYVLFYLKMCLKSLKHDGKLYREVGTRIIPYDIKKLSEITKTPVDTVIVHFCKCWGVEGTFVSGFCRGVRGFIPYTI